MELLNMDINQNPLFDTFKDDVEQARLSLASLQMKYLEGIEKIKFNAESLNDKVSEFEKIINNKLNLITDKVFVKQIQKKISDHLIVNENSISYEEATSVYEKFSSDVDDIINSRIPNWVSSLFYTFNSNWRRIVYTEIMENYLILYTYVCEQKAIANNIESKMLDLKNEYQLEANAIVSELLSSIRSAISNLIYDDI